MPPGPMTRIVSPGRRARRRSRTIVPNKERHLEREGISQAPRRISVASPGFLGHYWRMDLRRRSAVVVGIGAVLVAGGARAEVVVGSSGTGWRGPDRVISHVSAGMLPHMVVAPDGRAFVAVSGSGADVVGAGIGADGAIGPSQMVAPAAEDPRHLGLGIASSGTVSAAYTSGSDSRSRVLLRQGVPGRAFGSPLQISPAGATATLVTFRETSDGFSVALLCLGNQRRCTYALYARAPGGRFRNVTELPTGAAHAAIAVAADHRVIAVWEATPSNGSPYLQGLGWRRGGRPTAPYTVARHTETGGFSAPQVEILAGGGAVVVWGVPLPAGRGAVDASVRRAAGGRFSAVRALTSGRDGHDTGQLRLSEHGGSVLLSTAEASRHGRYRAVLRSWTAAHGFGQPQIGSPASSDAFDPFAAAGGRRTVLAWDSARGGNSIKAATAVAGGAFGAPAHQ
jgi:hypothetical protein